MPRVSAAYLRGRREEILAAAVRCFARDGFHRTTMHDVAREAALSSGALYRYFTSKASMVAAIASRHHAADRRTLRAAAKGDVRQGLRRIAGEMIGRLADPAEREWRRVTVQLWSEALRDERLMRVVRGGLEAPLATLASLVRRGQREGTLSPDLDPKATARAAAAIFQGLVLQQAWDPELDVAAGVRAAEALLDALCQPPRR